MSKTLERLRRMEPEATWEDVARCACKLVDIYEDDKASSSAHIAALRKLCNEAMEGWERAIARRSWKHLLPWAILGGSLGATLNHLVHWIFG